MSNRFLTRMSAEIQHIRKELRWIVFEVAISMVRKAKDRVVPIDVAEDLERITARLRRVAARKG